MKQEYARLGCRACHAAGGEEHESRLRPDRVPRLRHGPDPRCSNAEDEKRSRLSWTSVIQRRSVQYVIPLMASLAESLEGAWPDPFFRVSLVESLRKSRTSLCA